MIWKEWLCTYTVKKIITKYGKKNAFCFIKLDWIVQNTDWLTQEDIAERSTVDTVLAPKKAAMYYTGGGACSKLGPQITNESIKSGCVDSHPCVNAHPWALGSTAPVLVPIPFKNSN